MAATRGNVPIKGLKVQPTFTSNAKNKYQEEPYEAHMVLLIQEFEALPESIKSMVNECDLCYGEGNIETERIVSGKPGLQIEFISTPCPNQCYLRNGS